MCMLYDSLITVTVQFVILLTHPANGGHPVTLTRRGFRVRSRFIGWTVRLQTTPLIAGLLHLIGCMSSVEPLSIQDCSPSQQGPN